MLGTEGHCLEQHAVQVLEKFANIQETPEGIQAGYEHSEMLLYQVGSIPECIRVDTMACMPLMRQDFAMLPWAAAHKVLCCLMAACLDPYVSQSQCKDRS